MKYIIIEIQTNTDGTVSTLVTTKDTRNEADAEFHRILSFAALSELPSHAAVLLTGDGNPIRNECYKHALETQGGVSLPRALEEEPEVEEESGVEL